MTYYLFKNETDNEPWEMILIKGDIDKHDIQKKIYELNYEYIVLEGKNDEKVRNYGYSYDYIIDKLRETYDLEIIPWANDDVLYY